MEQLIQPQTEIQGLNIYQRILEVMREVSYVAKGDQKVNGQYRFVSHDDVAAKIHPMLVTHGIAVIPTVEECIQENNRTRVKLAVVFRNVDNPNDAFAVYHYGYGVDNSDKGIGKAVSYAFKYALLKTFCLETGEDPDQDAKSVYEPQKCEEFDLLLPQDISAKDMQKIVKFVEERAKSFNKHPEDIKREAIKRMPEFMTAVKNWDPKKKD
jgi:ERF superfamily protein